MKLPPFNVLVADDDPNIAVVVPMILRRLGHNVEAVADGKEAIALLAAHPGHYDVLITDHSMKEVSGPELVDHFRAHGFRGKIVVMSGSLTDEWMHSYLAKRVDKILQKPFTMELLSSTFRDLFDNWKDEGKP